jgi:HK97 gp10 family phage protein
LLELTGLNKLEVKFKRLIGILSDKDLENRVLHAAKVIRDDAKSRAPIAKKGHWKKYGRGGGAMWVEPGSLRRAIIAKTFKGKSKEVPSAFAAIDYRIAPHAHLVEFGARGGQMPADPFFRPAIDSNRMHVVSIIKRGLQKTIKRETKKIGTR